MQMVKEKQHTPIRSDEKAVCVATLLHEKKASDVLGFDLRGISGFTEYMLVACATSVRHGQALADALLAYCKQQNLEFLRVEGYDSGTWILLDMNDVVVNIFQPDTRSLYDLEGLWADAPKLLLPVP